MFSARISSNYPMQVTGIDGDVTRSGFLSPSDLVPEFACEIFN